VPIPSTIVRGLHAEAWSTEWGDTDQARSVAQQSKKEGDESEGILSQEKSAGMCAAPADETLS